MTARDFSRRGFGAMLGAGALWPGLSNGAAVVRGFDPSRLPPPVDHSIYVPPGDLKTIADIYARMTAPVKINGQGPYAFVVDTGANQSVISEALADQLGLVRGPSQPLHGVAGVQDTPTTTARLIVGERAESEALLSVLPASAMGGTGTLGLDRLEGGRLTLDFHRQLLSIDGRSSRYDSDVVSVKATRRSGQLTLVDADLAGMKLVAFLDSGAQDTIGNMALRQVAMTRYPKNPWAQTPIVSVTGQTISAEVADLPDLRIGGMHLPNWPVAFADLHTFRMWDLVRSPAILIGVDVLSRFETVCLDFNRDEVRFRLPGGRV